MTNAVHSASQKASNCACKILQDFFIGSSNSFNKIKNDNNINSTYCDINIFGRTGNQAKSSITLYNLHLRPVSLSMHKHIFHAAIERPTNLLKFKYYTYTILCRFHRRKTQYSTAHVVWKCKLSLEKFCIWLEAY